MKRTIDVVLSAAGLLFVLPLVAAHLRTVGGGERHPAL